MPVAILPIGGTHAVNGSREWWRPGSRFLAFWEAQGAVYQCDEPFEWSFDLDGSWWERKQARRDWIAGGKALRYYIGGLYAPAPPDVIFAHSHGLQVALYAAASGLRIPVLVSMMSPVRRDMECVARLARQNIGHWCHLHGGRKDWWQWLGELGDGRIGIVRQHPLADHNVAMPGASHGSLLSDMRVWRQLGLVDHILGEVQRCGRNC